MIEQRIQDLFREAVFKTAVQGTRCGMVTEQGRFVCQYTDDKGRHCAVGHALTPPQQVLVGDYECIADLLVAKFKEVKDHLGCTQTEEPFGAPHLWSAMQRLHDASLDSYGAQSVGEGRPFGVSWSAWFWYRARSLSKQFGFDIGNYPRAEVRYAQAA